MISAVVGVPLMFVPLSAIADSVFRVDVNIPQREGRNEMEDIKFIDTTLKNLKGIDVIFQRKGYDNKLVVLVLEPREMCSWSSLTGALSKKGYELSVASLQRCSDYAKGLGVDLCDEPVEDVQNSTTVELLDVTYYDQGMETCDYKEIMTKLKQLLAKGIKTVCYRSFGTLPVRAWCKWNLFPKRSLNCDLRKPVIRNFYPEPTCSLRNPRSLREMGRTGQYHVSINILMYFDRGTSADMKAVFKMISEGGKAMVEFRLLQDVKAYTEETC